MEDDPLMSVKLVAALIHIGAGWFLVALSVPFIRRRIKPNQY